MHFEPKTNKLRGGRSKGSVNIKCHKFRKLFREYSEIYADEIIKYIFTYAISPGRDQKDFLKLIFEYNLAKPKDDPNAANETLLALQDALNKNKKEALNRISKLQGEARKEISKLFLEIYEEINSKIE